MIALAIQMQSADPHECIFCSKFKDGGCPVCKDTGSHAYFPPVAIRIAAQAVQDVAKVGGDITPAQKDILWVYLNHHGLDAIYRATLRGVTRQLDDRPCDTLPVLVR